MYKREDIKEGMKFKLNPSLLNTEHIFWNRVSINLRKYIKYHIERNLFVTILSVENTETYFAQVKLKQNDSGYFHQTYYLSLQDLNEMFLPQHTTLKVGEDYYQ